jgi:fructan beta-fructosidase
MNQPIRRHRLGRFAKIAWLALLMLSLVSSSAVAQAPTAVREDIVIADFEGDTYGAWKTTGSAFGGGPAKGTLPGQMDVTCFQGRGLVNSFHGGDGSTGTLSSPPIEIKRPYLNFLIGGGKYPGKTCIELLVDGKGVREATGPNDKPGGAERLEWASWDVSELVGKTASLRITDAHTGGWGHINVDQIVQSDAKKGVETITRTIVLNRRYFHLPVNREAAPRPVKFSSAGRSESAFEIRFPEASQKPDFWVFIELPNRRGQTFEFEAKLPAGSKALDAIAQSDDPPGADVLYREKDRPQFHFTSRRGWLNDPNGLVWHQGKYHLFYQHNPFGWEWGNMNWGHAVSPDMLHWTELPDAISPRKFGDMAFSGSAVVDQGVTGVASPTKDKIVAAFTSTGRGECIGDFAPDASGWKFHEYEKNPVVKHTGRDPRLLRHKASNRWVMAVYDESDGKQWIAFHSSPDLKEWRFESRIEGFFECPDLFELPVAGEPNRSLWVLYGADGAYMLGQFDGRQFIPQTKQKHRVWHGNFYAAQTFSDTPDGRRIQIGWGNGIAFPGMPFNQQMTIPCELTLRPTDDGVRMFANPVSELASLRGKVHARRDLTAGAGSVDNPLAGIAGDLFEIQLEAEVGPAAVVTLNARGVQIVYDALKKTLTCGDKKAPLAPEAGKIHLQVLVDRGSVEVFANAGRVAISHGAIAPEGNRSLSASVAGADTRIRTLEVFELKSAWR